MAILAADFRGKGRPSNSGQPADMHRLALKARKKSRRVKPHLASASVPAGKEVRGNFTGAGSLCRGFAVGRRKGPADARYTGLDPFALLPARATGKIPREPLQLPLYDRPAHRRSPASN